MPVQDLFSSPATPNMKFSLEPAQNALQSLFLLLRVDKLSGLSEWVVRTEERLSPQERDTHRLVMLGFHYAVLPRQSWPSFPAYLQRLSDLQPEQLREKLFNTYLQIPCLQDAGEWQKLDLAETQRVALQSPEAYLQFLRSRFQEENIDPEVETHAYRYLIDPGAMQALILSHLSYMWDRYLEAEWERVKPMLDTSVRAFQQLDMQGRDRQEVIRLIAGQNFQEEKWFHLVEESEKVTFVPNAHLGPYLSSFWTETQLWLFYGARLPEGTGVEAPDLSRNEILVRLGALADDTRLQILKLIAENGEQRSQEIMQQLDLSQSASSRHLTQLSATGYLVERRCEGAKCYQLNPDRVKDTLQAVSVYLLKRPLGG